MVKYQVFVGRNATRLIIHVYLDMAPPLLLILLAVQPFDLKVRVEVEDDPLGGFRRLDDPVAVLMRRVLQGIPG